jgi:hypothetical protein
VDQKLARDAALSTLVELSGDGHGEETRLLAATRLLDVSEREKDRRLERAQIKAFGAVAPDEEE